MAKEATKTKSTEVAEANPELDNLMQQYKGAGVSTAASDNIVPQIKVLQPLSPEVTSGRGHAGDIYLGDESVPGDTGVWFQPAHAEEVWFEFTPREQGGGFVAGHGRVQRDRNGDEIPPQGARRVKGTWRYRFDNGNECVHYRQWSGILWEEKRPREFAINFTSTGHTVAKQWNMKALQSNRFQDGSSRALWAHVYHLNTEQRRNKLGTWYLLDVGPAVLLGSAESREVVSDAVTAFNIGVKLAEAFAGGEKHAEQPAAEADAQDEEAM